MIQRQRMRVTLRRAIGLIGICGVILAIGRYLLTSTAPRDAVLSAICALDGHHTVYAPGYSESKFRAVRSGMTPSQVVALLGPAPWVGSWGSADRVGGEAWSYTRPSRPNGNYWLRVVYSEDGRVDEVDAGYYVD
jgi:hypothetical protein